MAFFRLEYAKNLFHRCALRLFIFGCFLFCVHSALKEMESRSKHSLLRQGAQNEERNPDDGRTCVRSRGIDCHGAFHENRHPSFNRNAGNRRCVYGGGADGRFLKKETQGKFGAESLAKIRFSSLYCNFCRYFLLAQRHHLFIYPFHQAQMGAGCFRSSSLRFWLRSTPST